MPPRRVNVRGLGQYLARGTTMSNDTRTPAPVNTRRTSLARSERIAAQLGADAWMSDPDETPVADTLSDITTREVTLDGGTVTVEHFYGADGGRVEMTVHLGGVLRSSLILTAEEGEALGMALARPYGPTVGDYFDMHDRLGCKRVQA